ncbi:hypothetical protein Mal15_57130 [Stieleria maiorica]|uniref:Uncharacterized protein n=1 Tax=Stieleria maiorica TaxID=2795974 RepID=A0A5B9MPG6_9BACT|nr:hypothetical protein Mal15_57130 [Stieleria maiorica]
MRREKGRMIKTMLALKHHSAILPLVPNEFAGTLAGGRGRKIGEIEWSVRHTIRSQPEP